MAVVEDHSRSGVPAGAQPARASVELVRVVLSVFNEAANTSCLIEHIVATMNGDGCDYEIIVIDDGTADGATDVVQTIAEDEHFAVIPIRHDANYYGIMGFVVRLLDRDNAHIQMHSRTFWLEWVAPRLNVIKWWGIYCYLTPVGYLHLPTERLRRHTPTIAAICRQDRICAC